MNKVYIKDQQDNKVLPYTHVSAVLDDEGNDLSSHLGAFEDEVRGLVETPHQEYVTVATYSALPASGSEDTIYRVSSWDGSANSGAGAVDVTVYSEYAWNGSDYVFLCVKSQIDEVFDITVYNSNTKYADLSAALGVNGVNIPESLRKGGMSVKYVQSSDNMYVQYRYMGTAITGSPNPFLDAANWQGVDDAPTAGSENLVKSGGVADLIHSKTNAQDYNEEIIFGNSEDDYTVKIKEKNVAVKGKTSNIVIFNNAQDYNEELVITNDIESDIYAKINKDGIRAKSFRLLNGKELINRGRIDILSTDSEIEILNKLLTAYNQGGYDVYWEHGTYTFSSIYLYMRDVLNWGWGRELPLGDNCRYFFNNSTIISNQPSQEYLGDDRNIFGTREQSVSFEVYDATWINNGGSYCMHDEGNGSLGNARHLYKNIIMKWHDTGASYLNGRCMGCGAGLNDSVIIDNCILESDYTISFAWHSNVVNNNPVTARINIFNSYLSGILQMTAVREIDDVLLLFNGNSIASDEIFDIQGNLVRTYIFNNFKRN